MIPVSTRWKRCIRWYFVGAISEEEALGSVRNAATQNIRTPGNRKWKNIKATDQSKQINGDVTVQGDFQGTYVGKPVASP